ncbi:MAG: formate--tetrahydrofolate ligase, partial [Ruminiclostridium sp.]|nr:formate--tetrahydrofolate ligase [Ruminiclostridium sp.]
EYCKEKGVEVAFSDVFLKGGEGGVELAEKVLSTMEAHKDAHAFKPLYDEALPIREKVEILAREIYRADGVIYTAQAEKSLKKIEEIGMDKMPICVAKTQYSLSDDPAKLGKPTGFNITVRDLKVSSGAGFVVVYTGDIMTMPGLPKKPAAYSIDIDNQGNITGLF